MTKKITLPSGKIATLKKGRGFDLLQAQQKAKTSEEIPYALIAELAEIDGQKLVYEDILELDLEDVIALQIFGELDKIIQVILSLVSWFRCCKQCKQKHGASLGG